MPNTPAILRPTVHPRGFSLGAELPYGLRVPEVRAAMEDVYDFLYSVNSFLNDKGYDRLEEILSGATFSTLMSELVVQSISRHATTLTKNEWHNGHPDLLPVGRYERDSCQNAEDGIEVKASRHDSWQGHNPESGWIMIFRYSVDVESQPAGGRRPTMFMRVLAARLETSDWSYSGRREGSRRTITAQIIATGRDKLMSNKIYEDPTLI